MKYQPEEPLFMQATHKNSLQKQEPQMLENVIKDSIDGLSFREHKVGKQTLPRYLATTIRTYLKDVVKQCLTENDSDTHIIAKDFLEIIRR